MAEGTAVIFCIFKDFEGWVFGAWGVFREGKGGEADRVQWPSRIHNHPRAGRRTCPHHSAQAAGYPNLEASEAEILATIPNSTLNTP